MAIINSGSHGSGTTLGSTILVYRYTVAGSAKASIDTGVDTPNAGSNDWTNGDLLEVYIYGRTDEAVVESAVNLNINNDSTAAHYLYSRVRGNGGAVAQTGVSNTSVSLNIAGASASSNSFTGTRVTMPNYAGTVGNKPFEIVQSYGDTTTGNSDTWLFNGSFVSTSAVTRVAIAPGTAGKNFVVGTQLLVYKRSAV